MPVHDAKLFELICSAVSDGVRLLREKLNQGHKAPNCITVLERSELPKNSLFTYNKQFGLYRPDYSAALGWQSNSLIRIDEVSSFLTLKEYLLSNARFCEYHASDLSNRSHATLGQLFENMICYDMATQLVEMFQVSFPCEEFDAEKLQPFYEVFEEEVFSPQLEIEFIVPILCVKCECTTFQITEHIEVREIPEQLQYGLAVSREYGTTQHKIVAGAATHALFVVKKCPNKSSSRTMFCRDEIEYPIDEIDHFFSTFRVITGVSVGYSEIGAHQNSWRALCYSNHSPYLTRKVIKKYPEFFEDGYWLRDLPTISQEQLEQVKLLYCGHFADKHFATAKRRINDWALRQRHDDATIDALIGLESLLADGQVTELTYKLSLRTAILLTKTGQSTKTALQIFDDMKDIYSYRSKVVHGADFQKIINKRFNGEESDVSFAAYQYLRQVILAQSRNPKLCNAVQIDRELILGENAQT